MPSNHGGVERDNYTPVVNIVTWIMAIAVLATVCAKVALKVLSSRAFDLDNALMLTALVPAPASESPRNTCFG